MVICGEVEVPLQSIPYDRIVAKSRVGSTLIFALLHGLNYLLIVALILAEEVTFLRGEPLFLATVEF